MTEAVAAGGPTHGPLLDMDADCTPARGQ
jgi:hypothetical protein